MYISQWSPAAKVLAVLWGTHLGANTFHTIRCLLRMAAAHTDAKTWGSYTGGGGCDTLVIMKQNGTGPSGPEDGVPALRGRRGSAWRAAAAPSWTAGGFPLASSPSRRPPPPRCRLFLAGPRAPHTPGARTAATGIPLATKRWESTVLSPAASQQLYQKATLFHSIPF